jgi:hypothetical protein
MQVGGSLPVTGVKSHTRQPAHAFEPRYAIDTLGMPFSRHTNVRDEDGRLLPSLLLCCYCCYCCYCGWPSWQMTMFKSPAPIDVRDKSKASDALRGFPL